MSTIKTDTLSNVAGTASVPTDTVVNGSAKAWVNWNGTGTVAIRAAFNVSSITDNGTGDYTVNFTTAMPDANYSAVCLAGSGTVSNQVNIVSDIGRTASAFRFLNAITTGAGVDRDYNQVAIFR